MEMLLVEPGKHRLGCGVVHFIGFLQVLVCVIDLLLWLLLQNADISADPADSCAIFMTVHHTGGKKAPALSAHCRFDDHIRCVAAKKNLTHKREALRLAKMTTIAEMLDLPPYQDQYTCKELLKYQGLSIVSKNSPRQAKGSHEHKDCTSYEEENSAAAKQLTVKNDDGSLVLPFNKEVEMSQLVFPLTPQETQKFDLLIDSSFSHEDRHLDQAQNNLHFDKHFDQVHINEQAH